MGTAEVPPLPLLEHSPKPASQSAWNFPLPTFEDTANAAATAVAVDTHINADNAHTRPEITAVLPDEDRPADNGPFRDGPFVKNVRAAPVIP